MHLIGKQVDKSMRMPYHNLNAYEKDDLTELELMDASLENNRGTRLPEAYSKLVSNSQVSNGLNIMQGNKSNTSANRSPANYKNDEPMVQDHQAAFASTLVKG